MTVPASTDAAIVRLSSVDSTQSVAFELAERGAADRTVVVADQQSAGRGRRGRIWRAPAGTSLLVSIVVRSRLPRPLLATLSPTTAVATAEALRRVASVTPSVKWPNDVLIGGRKIAGILLESKMTTNVVPGAPQSDRTSRAGAGVSEPGRTALGPPSASPDLSDLATMTPATIIGIGVNLGQREFPPDLAKTATSIALETGHSVDRETMLAVLLEEFDAWRARLEGEGFSPIRDRWRALSHTLGRHVTVNGISGVAVDLDADGALLVDVGGAPTRVSAGEIAADASDAGAVPPACDQGKRADAARR